MMLQKSSNIFLKLLNDAFTQAFCTFKPSLFCSVTSLLGNYRRRLFKEDIFLSLIFFAQIDIHSPGLKNCGKIEKYLSGIFSFFTGFCRMGSNRFAPLDVGEVFA